MTSFWILIGICVTGNVIGVVAAILSERRKRHDFLAKKLETAMELEAATKLRVKSRNLSFSSLTENRYVSAVSTTFRSYFDYFTLYNDYLSRVDAEDKEYNNPNNRVAQLRKKYLEEIQVIAFITLLLLFICSYYSGFYIFKI